MTEPAAMLSWTASAVAAALGGVLVGEDVTLTGVDTDSRRVEPGSLFVALRGEHYDGHDYVGAALAGGAAAVLVEPAAAAHPDSGSAAGGVVAGSAAEPRIEVADTATGLRDLAVLRRSTLTMPVVAVTGSSGKTSTKDLLASALPGASASVRSFNNEVGVPLTVLATPGDAAYLVVEVGSRGSGHIAWLMPAVEPDVAVITNVGVAHLETFGSVERLLDAKWELVEALGPGGAAVLPVTDRRLRRAHAGTTLTFGPLPSPGGSARLPDVGYSGLTLADDGRPTFDLSTPVGRRRVRLRMAGAHQADNAAAAVAAGVALGVDLDDLCAGLELAEGSPWRMEIHRGRYTVVNDAYNANPDSMLAALRMVAQMPGRRLAVLGRMAELGRFEAEEHRRVGTEARELGFTRVVTVGDDPGLAAGAGGIAVAAADIDEATAITRALIEPGDVVLVKASRAVGLEQLAQRLVEDDAGHTPQTGDGTP